MEATENNKRTFQHGPQSSANTGLGGIEVSLYTQVTLDA